MSGARFFRLVSKVPKVNLHRDLTKQVADRMNTSNKKSNTTILNEIIIRKNN